MSLAARVLNVFATPGAVFEDVRDSRHAPSSWLIPAVILGLVGALTGFVLFSQPQVQKQLRDQLFHPPARATKGKAASDAATADVLAQAERFMTPQAFQTLGIVVGMISSIIRVAWWAFVLWIIAKLFMRRPLFYRKALEIAGLGMMIACLGGLVTLLLMVNVSSLSNLATLGQALNLEGTGKSKLIFLVANVFAIWGIAVLSIGLGRLTNVPAIFASRYVVLYWILQQILFLMLSPGASGP